MTAAEPESALQTALLTPRGRGAIAAIVVRADIQNWDAADSLPFRAANCRRLSAQLYGRIVFGRWGAGIPEEVVVCAVDADTLEIHCHGGDAAAERILHDLEQAGCCIVPWFQIARRAGGLLEAELLAALSRATTLRTAGILLEQTGDRSGRGSLLRAAIEQGEQNQALPETIGELLGWAEFGLHLGDPWKVAIIGRPNVGKSSLINAILGYTRSIVYDQPGTTRDVVTAQTAVDGWPIEFSDTAGLRETAEPLEAAGIARARDTLEETDLAVVLIDSSEPISVEDRTLLAACPDAIVVAHKCDLQPSLAPDASDVASSATWIQVSSKTGEGVQALLSAIAQRLIPWVPAPGKALPVTRRQVDLLRQADEAVRLGDLVACRGAVAELLL